MGEGMSGKLQLEWPGVRFLPHHQFDTGRDTYVTLAFPDRSPWGHPRLLPVGLGDQKQGEQVVESHPYCACLLLAGSPFEEAFETWKNMALSLWESLAF